MAATLLRLQGRTAVVTGAAGGIGRGIALALGRRGCHVALADIDDAGLARTAAEVSALGVRASSHHLDVADAAAVAAFPERVTAEHPGVDVLVNNAGVALAGTFEQIAAADFDWLIAVNFFGVVRMTRAFLPLLHNSDDARLVNISSVYGLIAPPGNTAYVASKFAVRGFSESLRHELAGSTIGVTVVHPGGVATAIARNARIPAGVDAVEADVRRKAFEALLRMPPEEAGEIIVRGAEHRRARVLVGADAKRVALIERLMPINYWKLIGRSVHR
ncbi:MAG TPA: SDR family NAD(P)-dependent oxidoreductase [Xanthobacteraceae bacterium]|nr:SDR family NAD(P)-dependent oxidoreductase [Xanthobacteraceae bacterium]